MIMANLKEEYTDVRNRTHKVEHIVVPVEDKAAREQIVEELFQALTGTGEEGPALPNFSMERGVSNGDRPICPEICRAGEQHQL